jgi:hypothetical protein
MTRKYGVKGTLFVTPGSELEKQALADFGILQVSPMKVAGTQSL